MLMGPHGLKSLSSHGFRRKRTILWGRHAETHVTIPESLCTRAKGPSDSEGAVTKSTLRRAEFHYGEYFADTLAAYRYLVEKHTTDETGIANPAAAARKERHTIARRVLS